MICNGVLAALVAITAACGFVEPWAALVVGAVAGGIAVFGVIFVERIRIDDPIGAVAVHGMAGVWGTLACGLFAAPKLVETLATGKAGLVYSGSFDQLGTQVVGLAVVGRVDVRRVVRDALGLQDLLRRHPRRRGHRAHRASTCTSTACAGYPEMYIPVPGGYGTESSHAVAARPPIVTAASAGVEDAVPQTS